MVVLIAVPFYNVAPELIDKAVRHAIAQSVDVVVLVAGDGQKPPVSVRNSRLVVGTFTRNRGTPNTQQAMLLGSPFPFYAPHGADDWIEPDHIARLRALRAPAAGSSRVWWHEGSQKPRILRSPRTWIEFGVFDANLLRAIGGYNPAEPCGQDSVVISLLAKHPGVRLTSKPTYHKVFRADSLTHDPRTRQGSPIRLAVKARNREVIQACERIGWANHAAIRAYRESRIPADVRGELEDRAAEVAKWLA